jgi:hypothetical protein
MVGHYPTLRRLGRRVNEGNEGRVDLWSVHHGSEVGCGSARRGSARGRRWHSTDVRKKGGGGNSRVGRLGRSARWAGSGRKGTLASWDEKMLFPLDMNSKIEIKVWKLI